MKTPTLITRLALATFYRVKNSVSLTCLLILAGLPSLSLASDFGVADWGMSIDEVKALETRANVTPFGAENYLIYTVAIKGIDHSRLVYQFEEGRLSEGRFIFQPVNRQDFNRALEQYYTVKSFISAQYGEPVSDQILFRYRGDELRQATAEDLAADNVILKTQWQSDTAHLQHQLAWHKDLPHHQIRYQPIQPIEPSM